MSLHDQALVRSTVRRGLTGGMILVVAVLCVVPLYWLGRFAQRAGRSGVDSVFGSSQFRKTVWTTAELAAGSVVIALVAGTALGWFAHRLPPHRRWMQVVPVLPLLTPAVAMIVGWGFLANPRVGYLNSALRATPFFNHLETGPLDIYTVRWIVVITGISLTGFVYVFIRSALTNIPQDLIDAGAVSSCSPRHTFFVIVIPLLRPALIYGGATVFVLALGQFTAPLLLGRQQNIRVLSTDIYERMSRFPLDYGAAALLAAPILLCGLLLILVQRVALRGPDRFSTLGGKANRSLSPTGAFGQICIFAWGVLAVLLPILALVVVSMQANWSKDIRLSELTLDNYREVFADDRLVGSIRNSVTYSVIAVAILLPLGYLIGRVITGRRDRRLGLALEVFANLPLGIPAIILGVGLVFSYINWPFTLIGVYNSPKAMVIVYVTLMIPFVVRLIVVALTNLGSEMRAAASVSGAGWFRQFVLIELPLLRESFTGAAMLCLIMLTHEFTASVLVRTRDTNVMATVLFDLWDTGRYPTVAVMALVMCAVTGALVCLASLMGGSKFLSRLDRTNG